MAMTADEVIVTLNKLLDCHMQSGHLGQPEYKRDIFRIFSNAYRNGLLEAQ